MCYADIWNTRDNEVVRIVSHDYAPSAPHGTGLVCLRLPDVRRSYRKDRCGNVMSFCKNNHNNDNNSGSIGGIEVGHTGSERGVMMCIIVLYCMSKDFITWTLNLVKVSFYCLRPMMPFPNMINKINVQYGRKIKLQKSLFVL